VQVVAFALATPLVVFERALSLVGKGQTTYELKHFLRVEAAVMSDMQFLCCFVFYWKLEKVERGLRERMSTLVAQ